MSDNPENTGGATPAEPTVTKGDLDKFASRLDQVAGAVANLSEGQKERELQDRVRNYEAKLNGDITTAETAVATIEGELAAAIDDGDSRVIAQKQRAMTEAVAARENAKATKARHQDQLRQLERRQGGSQGAPQAQGQPQQADAPPAGNPEKLNNWKSKHQSWYGVDTDMTKAAHEIDKTIRQAGVIPVGSDQYFEAIDRQMARKYPDQFSRTPDTAGAGGPSTSAGGPRAGRIQQSVVDGWRRMGINTDDPATIERMLKHREKLVRKEILPSTPETGRIRY